MNCVVGQSAPDFTCLDDQEKSVSLGDFRSGHLILYFYPKDQTRGCTKQACAFRAQMADITERNAVIVGVSKDDTASHQRFRQRYDLPFRLLCDTQGTLCQDYGTWVEKSMYGRHYMGIDRSTFLIDKDGILRHMWRKVKVPGHVDAVLAALKSL